MKKTYLLILLLFITITFGFAQSQNEDIDKFSFTLEEATDYAQKHAYEVIKTGYELQESKKRIWETIASGLPQVNAEANYNDNLKLQTSLLPAKISNPEAGDDEFVPVKFGQQYTADAAITATQLIFDGTYIVGLKASKVYYQLTEDKMEKVRQEIKEGVMMAYFYALAAEENYETLKESLENSKKTYEEAKAYYEVGLREDTDADQAELSVADITARTNEAKRSITSARTTLKYLMGLDVNTVIDLESSLKDLISEVLLQNEDMPIDWINHIDYRLLETQYEAQRLMVRKEQAEYLPTLSAFYRFAKNSSSNEWNVFDSDTEWFNSSIVGFKVSLPIFSSGMRYSRVQQAKLKLRQVETEVTQKLQELEQNKIKSKNNLEAAKANYLTSTKAKELAKKIYEKTKLKYTEGVSNSFELTQNEQQYLEAHANQIAVMIQLLNASVEYEKALGILYIDNYTRN